MLHGTGRNMCYSEMLASHLHKGNYGYTQILYCYDYNGTGMKYIKSEGTQAVGKCPCYAFIKIRLRGNCQILQFIL